MFLPEKAIKVQSTTACDFIEMANTAFDTFIHEAGCVAGIMTKLDPNLSRPYVVCASNLPVNPFNVSKNSLFATACRDIMTKNASPHVHGLKNTALLSILDGITNTSSWCSRTAFVPILIRDEKYLLFAFANNEKALAHLISNTEDISSIVATIYNLCECEQNRRLLHVMQIYVREVGHDIASSIQAITAKLSNIRKGYIQSQTQPAKLQEAESELYSMYRSADNLGITVDPDYNISEGQDIDAREIVDDVYIYCESEAVEHHIVLEKKYDNDPIPLWGDKRALRIALMHLVMNGIKYAKGSTTLTIRVTRVPQNQLVEFLVSDVGKPIDEEEKIHMWEFGWRGDKAKEMHVNGSGIGLYTVKKIVSAHGGSVGCCDDGSKGGRVTFYFQVPPKSLHNKERLLTGKMPISEEAFVSSR